MIIPLKIRLGFRSLLSPLVSWLRSSNVSPNSITVLGIFPAIAAGILFAGGRVRLGAILVGISGLFDLIDGQLAKLSSCQTKFGALLDSTLDRYSEIAIFIGLSVLFRNEVTFYGVILALTGSLMVSYVKARVEGLGWECKFGLFQRPERIVLIIIGGLAGLRVLRLAVWILAFFGNLTAIERLLFVRRDTSSGSSGRS
ncbi:MAG: CDP-alcohol phosphatidyltransferase family protein [bacterium]